MGPPIWNHLMSVKMAMTRMEMAMGMIHGGRGTKRGGFGEEERNGGEIGRKKGKSERSGEEGNGEERRRDRPCVWREGEGEGGRGLDCSRSSGKE